MTINSFSFFNAISSELLFIIFLSIIVLILVIWLFILSARLKKIFRGKTASDLESVLNVLTDDFKKLDVNRVEMEKYLETVERRLRGSIQKVNTVRFNPFENAGSNQSFSTAFLDENGDGVVLSSLYSREGVRVYAKPIKARKSEYTFSKEEEEAIHAK